MEEKRWFEDDGFWRDMAPHMFPAERLAGTPAEVEQILALAGPPPDARVLDLCCGPGRHSLELARRGFRVTGVDRTAAYLEQARCTALAENLTIELVREDMRTFRREAGFELALSLFTSFGFFDDQGDDRRVIENLRASLAANGVLVIETIGKEVLARTFRERDWHREPGGALLLEERSVAPDWSYIEARWILIREGRQREYLFRIRLYAAAELAGLLRAGGFRDVRVCGNLAGDPYDHLAKRLVIVARP
jgi:SAM-dependent methyltransferase